MKWARIENGIVVETTGVDPAGRFVLEIEQQFISCPDNIEQNWTYAGGTFSQPQEPTPTKESINAQVVAKIRERYSIDNEFQMQRLGMLDPNNMEYQAYLLYVQECVSWSDAEKAKYNL
ncbi:hypothetical protein [Dehalobacter sp.]|uniref:hypothetical protein n=1 Tax=Dehalobacter sp. TaxID=1962289 RepID=UPI002588C980|nr:hypothetical protein [Dehalobacter sp.]MDJ0305399.1 hypothetical protein [Dehalobacter sp.]